MENMHNVLWNMDDILFMQAMKITRFRKCILCFIEYERHFIMQTMKITRFRKCILCFIEYERHFIYASDGNIKI